MGGNVSTSAAEAAPVGALQIGTTKVVPYQGPCQSCPTKARAEKQQRGSTTPGVSWHQERRKGTAMGGQKVRKTEEEAGNGEWESEKANKARVSE